MAKRMNESREGGLHETAMGFVKFSLEKMDRPAALVDMGLAVLFANSLFLDAFGHAARDSWLDGVSAGERDELVRFIDSCIARSGSTRSPEVFVQELSVQSGLTLAATVSGGDECWILIEFIGSDRSKEKESSDESSISAAVMAQLLHDLQQPIHSLALIQGVLAARSSQESDSDLLHTMDQCLSAVSGMLAMLADKLAIHEGDEVPALRIFSIADVLSRIQTEFAYHALSRGIRWRTVPSSAHVRSNHANLTRLMRSVLARAVARQRGGSLLLGVRRRGTSLSIELWAQGEQNRLAASNPASKHAAVLPDNELLGVVTEQKVLDLAELAGVVVQHHEGDGPQVRVLIPRADLDRTLSPTGIAGSPDEADQSRLQSDDRAADVALAQLPTMPRDWTVFIVDDDYTLAKVMQKVLQEHYAVEIFDGAEAFLAAIEGERIPPRGCVLVDVNMPYVDGFQLLAAIQERQLPLACIMITAHGDIRKAVHAIRSGATDFIEKPFHVDYLKNIVQRVHLNNDEPGELSKLTKGKDVLSILSPRQKEVLHYIVDGHTNNEIAHKLNISVRTVENHRAEVMRRTGARRLSDLVKICMTQAH